MDPKKNEAAQIQKLKLVRSTLRTLSSRDLARVLGRMDTGTAVPSCDCSASCQDTSDDPAVRCR